MKSRIGIALCIVLLGVLLGFIPLFSQTGHGIKLTWPAEVNNSDVAVGFFVYRGTVSGGPYTKLNATALPITTLTYFDSSVTGGMTYFYTLTAVDSQGDESAKSTEASATAVQGAPNPPAAPTAVAQ